MTPLQKKMLGDLRIRGRSENTQKAYVLQIKKFAEHFGTPPDKLGLDEIRAYQVYLVEHKRASLSQLTQFVAATRFLYTVTLDREWTIGKVPYPKLPKRLPEILTEQDVNKLIASVSNKKHRAILTTLYAAGLRVSEACGLRVSDVDSQRMMLRVEQGKGAKDRYVPLARTLLNELRDYWRQYRPSRYMFPGRRGRPLTSRHVYRVCVDAGKAAGIRQSVNPHLLRHSFATHLLDRGANILQVQAILGHTSLQTTSNYIHLSQSQLRNMPNPLDLFVDPPAKDEDAA
jgi:site-specific recombinase XerD